MQEYVTLFRSFESALTTLVFAALTIVVLISYSRASALKSMWLSAIQDGRVQKISSEDLLRPWLVRVYQRSRAYSLYGLVLLSISITVFIQAIISSTPVGTPVWHFFAILRVIAIAKLFICLLLFIFSTQMGLRAEVHELRKLLPNHNITFEALQELHEQDQELHPQDILPPDARP